MNNIEFSDFLDGLRSELDKSIVNAEGKDLQFTVEDIELEVSVSASKEGGTSGKVKFWVAELGAEGSISKAYSQKLKLRLKPVGDPRVSNAESKPPGIAHE